MNKSRPGMLKEAIEMLQWGIDNKKNIGEIQFHFKRGNSFLRRNREVFKAEPGFDKYESLYNRVVGRQVESLPSEDIEGLLDKSFEVIEDKISFTEIQQNKGILDAIGRKHVRTLDDLLAEAKVNLSIYKVDRFVQNKWDVTNADGDTYQNWQVKAWLEKIRTDDEQKLYDAFIEQISTYAPKYAKVKRDVKAYKKYSFIISCPDVHVGKMSWDLETLDGDYDTKIAIGRYNEAVDTFIQRATSFKDEIEEVVLPTGNDLINIDNFRNETTNGTPQSVDSRWQKMFMKTQSMIIANIDKLREIAPVKVPIVCGNHDSQTMFYLGEALKAWYRNVDNVTIDNSPSQRKYYSYGNNLIVWSHGNEEKHHDLGMIIAAEMPQLWANAKFREIQLGHYHKKKETRYVSGDEFQGFKMRILPSLSASDAWHASKGYRSQKAAMAFLYDKINGLVAEYTYNVM